MSLWNNYFGDFLFIYIDLGELFYNNLSFLSVEIQAS